MHTYWRICADIPPRSQRLAKQGLYAHCLTCACTTAFTSMRSDHTRRSVQLIMQFSILQSSHSGDLAFQPTSD